MNGVMEGGYIWCYGKKWCSGGSCFGRAVFVCGSSSGFNVVAFVLNLLIGLSRCVAAPRISMRRQLFQWNCFGV